MFFGVGVSCHILHPFVGYLYVSGSGSITSVGEGRAYLSVKPKREEELVLFLYMYFIPTDCHLRIVCYCLLVIMWFLLERFPLLLDAWDGLHYFIVALTGPSI